MASTIQATSTVDSPTETPIAQPARTPRHRRVALGVSALAAAVGVAALAIAVVGNDTDDSAPSGPVFTEHARLHVVDWDAPASLQQKRLKIEGEIAKLDALLATPGKLPIGARREVQAERQDLHAQLEANALKARTGQLHVADNDAPVHNPPITRFGRS
jgi:hypothetical protein